MADVIDPSDPTVTKLQNAARNLHARKVPTATILAYVRDALAPPPPPKLQLPAVLRPPTHPTAGLPDFPANDLFAPAGRAVGAPDDGQLIWPHLIPWSLRARCGGWTCYYRTAHAVYFLTHFGDVAKRGTYKRGDIIGHVGVVPHGWWAPHIHEGRHDGVYVPPET